MSVVPFVNKVAQVRYVAGAGTNADVMDEQVALTTAQTNYIQALYDYNTRNVNCQTKIKRLRQVLVFTL